MSKTWTITQERTVVKRIVVEGATEEEALENYIDYDEWLDSEDVDEYDWEVTGVEEDIPDMNEHDFATWDEYAQWCRDNGDPTFGTVDGEPVTKEEWEKQAIDWQCDKGICDYSDRARGKCDCYKEQTA